MFIFTFFKKYQKSIILGSSNTILLFLNFIYLLFLRLVFQKKVFFKLTDENGNSSQIKN